MTKEKHAPKAKRAYQKPQLYTRTRQRESEPPPVGGKPGGDNKERLRNALTARNTLLIAGYAEPMELIVPALGKQGLVASWNETNRGNKFLTIQLRESTHGSGHALSVLDFREVSTRSEDWLSELREDPKFSSDAVALLLVPPDLQQKMRNPWVGSCWQNLESLTPDDLAGVLCTFLRVCVQWEQG